MNGRFVVTLLILQSLPRGPFLVLRRKWLRWWPPVNLRRSNTRIREGDSPLHWCSVITPSGHPSRRTIALTDALVKDLKGHPKRQLQERLLAGGDWVENGLVFTTNRGTPLDGVNVTRAFRRLQKRAGISPVRRFHDLRHTAATLLMAGDVHPRIVAELLGHTDTRTTLDLYSHVSTAMQREASEQLHQIVEKAKAGGAKR